MQVRLLGPVEIVGPDQASRPVSGLRRKAVLAVLALRAGEIVSAGQIIEAVWGQDAATAVNTLQTNVSYLRRVLGDPAAIVARADKVREVLGWQPEHEDLNEIVTTALEWERYLMRRNS